jgi:hypothetical protein
MGRLAAPSLIAQAAAPTIGAVLISRLGAESLLGFLGVLAVLNLCAVLCLSWLIASARRYARIAERL